ncbi:hypothetical protein GCM10010389_33280 [Streptomyces echinoruber]|uniref:Uncharacterized protein n=1 Tax=Streptomyces echinoruber TaxID=68898 RepID=A0A918VF53_9ACTN|nr:hypothetical protein GCM10010389_33280 [Streptomyces echinoruber]
MRLDPSLPQRALAKKYGVHRRPARQAIASAIPPPRKVPRRKFRILAPAVGWIDAMLREDLRAPRKQKHTVERIVQRLAEEHDFDQASYSSARNYVRERRPEIAAEGAGTGQHPRRPGLGEGRPAVLPDR